MSRDFVYKYMKDRHFSKLQTIISADLELVPVSQILRFLNSTNSSIEVSYTHLFGSCFRLKAYQFLFTYLILPAKLNRNIKAINSPGPSPRFR